MHPSTLAKRLHFFLLLVFLLFYFYGLGHLPLIGPDEPRYAQVGREMLQRGDLITPTLGGHTWFEKPALLYWMEIAAFKIFGVHEWTARLGPALCGVLTILALWFLIRQIERTTTNDQWQISNKWIALIASSCFGLIAFSRGASFDIVITMTTTWALSFFLLGDLAQDSARRTRYLLGFYVFIGLSLLAKGLVGVVIPFGVVSFYYLLRRIRPNSNALFSLLWGLPVAALVSSVWYGPVIYKHGWHFIDEFFVQHHFARYLSNKYHHPQPFYFYLVVLLMLVVPWVPFLIDALFEVRNWKWRGQDSASRLLVFSFAWVLFPVLFFSFSSSKLPGYILPVVPPALILIGSSLTRFQTAGRPRWPIRLTGVLWFAVGLGAVSYGLRVEHLSTACTALAAAPIIIAGLIAVLWGSAWRSGATLSLAFSVLLGAVVILNCGGLTLVRRESTRDLLLLADARGYSKLQVLALPGNDRSAEFYASGRVIYGANGEVTPVYDAPDIVAGARERNEKLLAFISLEDLDLYRGKTGVEIIGDNGKLALVCLY